MPRARVTCGFALLLLGLLPIGAPAQEVYWDTPRAFATGARFVQTAASANRAVLAWQEFVDGSVYLSLASTTDFRGYIRNERFFGPIPYSEKEVPIFSLAVTPGGDIYVAVLTGPTTFAVLVSKDGGASFRPAGGEHVAPGTTVAPYLSVSSTNALLLFVTQTAPASTGVIEAQPIRTRVARSTDGVSWSAFQPLVPDTDPTLRTNLKPFHAAWQGRDYVVFQAVDQRFELGYYHLYLRRSTDGGASWGPVMPLEFREQAREESVYDNQRPYLAPVGQTLGLAWERRIAIGGTSQVYYVELDGSGVPLTAELTGSASGTRYRASSPQILVWRGEPYLLWFDNRAEEGRVVLAERGELRWVETDLTARVRGTNLFGRPVVLGNDLYVAWDNQVGDRRTVQLLEPDRAANPPQLAAVDFNPGRPESRSRVTVRWSAPADPSGIRGYSTTWDRDPAGTPPEVVSLTGATATATLMADEDGPWYLHVRAVDNAGNWSEPSTVVFLRDTTPPPPVAIVAPQTDAQGYLLTNDYRLAWEPQGDEEITGYAWRVDPLGPAGMRLPAEGPTLPDPPRRWMGTQTLVTAKNADDGTFALSVSSIDAAGNFAPPATLVFRLNKWVPVTEIFAVRHDFDEFDALSLSLSGRGFAQGGLVRSLILDRDGAAPWDYEWDLETSGAYVVQDDRNLRTNRLPDLDSGTYRVGLIHPTRGLSWAGTTFTRVDRGTIKIGEYQYSFRPSWEMRPGRGVFVNATTFLVWLVVLFLGLLVVVSARRLVVLAGEGRMLREEVMAIIEGRESTMKKRQELAVAARRGMGLRLKFTLLMTILVLLIVLMLSLFLGFYMVVNQRTALQEGLQNQLRLLSSSIAQGAEEPLAAALRGEGGIVELSSDLPQQIDQMDEVTYVVITGPGQRVSDREHIDYVWGSKDSARSVEEEKRRTPSLLVQSTDLEQVPGVRLVIDEVQAAADALRTAVDEEARAELGDLRAESVRLSQGLAGLPAAEQVAVRESITALEQEIAQRLLRYKREKSTSVPPFEIGGEIQDEYTIIKPIIRTERGDDAYVRGYVRLGVSTDRIRAEIRQAIQALVGRTGLIALAALGMGILGAIVLASMTVAPIKRLARGVAVIRDTEDKEQLHDHRIEVGTRDEIGVLAQTVNEMTQGLATAATAAKDLTVGQETQKMFITLDVGKDGKKGNSGGLETKELEIFGFYEGARTVSGDYFEYVKLDDKHYALMKCDVAGKGVPAALVMVEVATLFSAFTRKWAQSQEKFRLDRFVYDVNDMLEVRGFKGRFAAFLVAILNVETGVAYICNAGDKLLHYFDGAEGKMQVLELPSSPAAGVFPSSLVELQTGFQQVKHTLRKGDVFVLHTDGVEEDHRTLRDIDGNTLAYDEPDPVATRRHGFEPKKGEQSEMIETERLFGVLDAALTRSTYEMVKFYNPNPGEVFTFDFTKGSGTLREAVYAVIGMDRVFRIYKDSTTDENSRIRMDRNVLEILRKHYVQFDEYFSHPVDDDGTSPQITFSHLAEDEQFDDLTLLMVRRKP